MILTIVRLIVAAVALWIGFRPAGAGAADEASLGAAEYRALRQQGVIVDASPWYAVLNDLGAKIARVADRDYAYPFRFVLVQSKAPNAFSAPGGNVYVTTSLMSFARNKEELAGVLCHEVAHDIHHDVVDLLDKQRTTDLVAAGLQLLLGGHSAVVRSTIGAGAQLQNLQYSRTVEEAADQTGARICAAAGYDPWGLVWLLQDFSASGAGGELEILSDHPTNDRRIAALETEFQADPATFGRFSSSRAAAHRLPSYEYLRAHYGSPQALAPARRPGY